jgi:S1-C subfamily serine protease
VDCKLLPTPSQIAAICVFGSRTVLALLVAAQNHPVSPPPSQTQPVISAVVQLLAVGAGVRGMNQDCSATGFLVNEEGYILTNAHVFVNGQECLAKNSEARIVAKFATSDSARLDSASLHGKPAHGARPAGGQSNETTASSVSCDLVGLDEVHDLAVLKTERLIPAVHSIPMLATGPADGTIPFVELSSTDMAVGTAVKVTGHPAFAWVALTQSGQIIARKKMALFETNAEQSEVFVLNIPLRRGNSGSPVYLAEGGAVVAVVERQNLPDRSQTVAVPIGYAIDLLNRLGVKWHAVHN